MRKSIIRARHKSVFEHHNFRFERDLVKKEHAGWKIFIGDVDRPYFPGKEDAKKNNFVGMRAWVKDTIRFSYWLSFDHVDESRSTQQRRDVSEAGSLGNVSNTPPDWPPSPLQRHSIPLHSQIDSVTSSTQYTAGGQGGAAGGAGISGRLPSTAGAQQNSRTASASDSTSDGSLSPDREHLRSGLLEELREALTKGK